jgi:hypothetical protein
MITSAPQFEAKTPTLLTPWAILKVSLYGMILVVPVVISMMVVSVLQFGLLTFLIPLATMAVATIWLPLGFGNPYIARLVRPLQPSANAQLEVQVVQLTRNPRHRSGLLALLEDADDVGCLTFTDSALDYNGDSFRLTAPYDRIRELKLQTAGWRALFVYGPQTTFSVAGLPEAGAFAFSERSSCLLPTSRKNAKRMYQLLHEKVQGSARSTAG